MYSMTLKHVAIFGGAFDPPTIAHIQVAKGVLAEKSLGIDEVWLMPAYTHTFGKGMIDFDTRMHLCRVAAEDVPGVRVTGFEETVAGRPGAVEDSTLKTLYELMNDYARGCTFKIIVGLDNALCIDKWLYSERLRDIASFIVIPRPGYQHDPHAWYMTDVCELYDSAGHFMSSKPQHQYLPNLSTGEMSSTHVRGLLHAWVWKDRQTDPPEKIKEWLDPKVLKEIVARGLYSGDPR